MSPAASDSNLTIVPAHEVILGENISMVDAQEVGSAGDFTISAPTLIVQSAKITLSSGGHNSVGEAGAINLSGIGTIAASTSGNSLALDARGATAGGAVSLGSVANAGGSATFLNKLVINTTGETQAGAILLSGDIRLDDNGSGQTAEFVASGGGTPVVGANITIDTEQGNDAAGGTINLDAGADGTLIVDGHLDASSTYQSPQSVTSGGQISLLGDRVGLSGTARVDVSGNHGGGTILIYHQW